MSQLSWVMPKLEEIEADFLIFRDRTYRYAELIQQIRALGDELRHRGIGAGECIGLVGDYSPTCIFLFLALVLNGNIIVPIGREARERQEEMFVIAAVTKWIVIEADDGWNLQESSGAQKKPLLDVLRLNHEPGIVIFTSGTSGQPKAAVLQVSKLIQKYQTINRKPYRSLIFLKLDHIGGVNTLFSTLFNGGTLVTSHSRTPEAICEAIQKYRVQLLPTTPTFLNMLIMSRCYTKYDLSSLKLITYGTEPMPQATLTAINQLLPSVTLKQTYGLTELGIFATKSRDSHSTWMKVGGAGTEIRIVDNTLWIRSDSAMLGYLNAPSPFDSEGWYNTGDQVESDGDYIRILGRQSEIINVGGEKVYPAEVENVLLEIPGIKDALVWGKKSPITGQIVAATVVLEEPEGLSTLRKRIVSYCKGRLQPFKIPTLIEISEHELVGQRFKKIRRSNG